MTENFGNPTPEAEQAKTDEPKQESEETYTKDTVSKLIEREVGKVVKKKEAEIHQLKEQIEELNNKDLGELERLQKKVEKLTQDINERDAELTGMRLKDEKIAALLAAGASSEQIPRLIKRVAGTTSEEIAADVEELKSLGWIGSIQKGADGSGHHAVSDNAKKTFTRSQIKKMSPEEYEANREAIMKAMQAGEIKGD